MSNGSKKRKINIKKSRMYKRKRHFPHCVKYNYRCLTPSSDIRNYNRPFMVEVCVSDVDKVLAKSKATKNYVEANVETIIDKKSQTNKVSGNKVNKRYVFTNSFIKQYRENIQFRKLLNTCAYIYSDGKFYLAIDECFDIIDGKIVLKKSAKNEMEKYCICYYKRKGKTYYMHAKYALCENTNSDDINSEVREALDRFKNNFGGGGNYPTDTYAKVLNETMNTSTPICTVERMYNITDIERTTIYKYKNGKRIPRLFNAMLINVALNTSLRLGLYMIELTGVYLRENVEKEAAYIFVLSGTYEMKQELRIQLVRFINENY